METRFQKHLDELVQKREKLINNIRRRIRSIDSFEYKNNSHGSYMW